VEAMTTWGDFEQTEPDLADRVRQRFEQTGLALVGTVRADGSPRVSGWEPLFAEGHIWLGSMPGSRKNADLRRDARLVLHAATVDKDAKEGDAKISGTAIEVTDDATKLAFTQAFKSATDFDVPTPFELFQVAPTEVSVLRPSGDFLLIEWWRPGEPLHRLERR
jgi:Pyridoxamine 5'-phosphate oxidase